MSPPSGGAPADPGLDPGLGPILIVLGLAVAVIGLLVWTGALSWFGRLPGDVHVERDGFQLWIPITSMLLVSVVLSVVLWVLRRLL